MLTSSSVFIALLWRGFDPPWQKQEIEIQAVVYNVCYAYSTICTGLRLGNFSFVSLPYKTHRKNNWVNKDARNGFFFFFLHWLCSFSGRNNIPLLFSRSSQGNMLYNILSVTSVHSRKISSFVPHKLLSRHWIKDEVVIPSLIGQ